MNDEAKTIHEDDEPEGAFEDMTEEVFQDFLVDAIGLYADETEGPVPRVRTFADEGVLTSNKGLVVRIGDAEFQVTIVRSR